MKGHSSFQVQQLKGFFAMRNLTSTLCSAVMAIFLISSPVFAGSSDNEQTRNDIELVKQLTRCVDHNRVVIDRGCLKDSFFPLLSLGEQDRVMQATFGFNTDGRWFQMTIRKVSRGGGTVGLYELTFYTERHRGTADGDLIFFDARGGFVYGKIPNDHTGVMSIYDLARGNYLVNDENGKVVDSLTLTGSQRWSRDHTLANLLNAGKTIGSVLEGYLETIEQSGKGGLKYTQSAMRRHSSFGGMDHKDRLKITFE